MDSQLSRWKQLLPMLFVALGFVSVLWHGINITHVLGLVFFAAWTTPRTWSTGEVVTKAIMDTHVRDNLTDLDARWDFFSADDTSASNTGGAEEVLFTHTIPANTLATNGDMVHMTASGTFDNSGVSKVVKIRLGGVSGTVCARVANNSQTDVLKWFLEAWIARTGSSTQGCWGFGIAEDNGSAPAAVVETDNTTGSETDSSNISLVVTADGNAASDISYERSFVVTTVAY